MKWLPSHPVTALLLYISGSVLVLLLLAYLGYLAWGAWRRLDELELKDRFAARNDFIKTTAQILGGAFFLITIYFTYQNLALSQKNLVATQEKNVTELYVKAIEQLGSDKLEVRLGGIYALERIAQQSPKDHGPIMEVLTAYVRENAPWPPEKPKEARKKRPWAKPRDKKTLPPVKGKTDAKGETTIKPDSDIQAVLTVLGRTAIPFAQKGELRRLDLRATHLAGIDLIRPNLQKANFSKANLQEAILWQADLQEAILEGANLQKARIWEANLQGASLYQAKLQGVSLSSTNLQGVSLSSTNLQGAELGHTNLQRVSLNFANLQGAELVGADLQGAELYGADLRGPEGLNMGAKGLTVEQVAVAYWDETTKWPEGFTPPAPRRLPPQPHKDEKKEGE